MDVGGISQIVLLTSSLTLVGLLVRRRLLATNLDAHMEPSTEKRCILYLLGRGLNETQAQVIARIAQEQTVSRICDELCVSEGTVNSVRFHAYRALHVHSREELVGLLQQDVGRP